MKLNYNSNGNIIKGISAMMFSAFFFSLMSLCVKLSGNIPVIQKVIFRNSIAAIIALFLLIKRKETLKVSKEVLPFVFARALAGTLGIICNFYAITHMILADASIIFKMAPFFTIIFSAIILKEKITWKHIVFMLFAFIGCIFIIKPAFNFSYTLIGCIALLGGACAALAHTYIRKLGKLGVSGTAVIFYFSAFSILFCAPFLFYQFEPMSKMQILSMLGAGISAGIAQVFLTSAYYYAPAKNIAIYGYLEVVFSALWSILFFSQHTDILGFLGYMVIILVAFIMYKTN